MITSMVSRVAIALMIVCGPAFSQVDLKEDAVRRVAQAHDPAIFVATGALYLKQEALRAMRGKSLSPEVEGEVNHLIDTAVRDAAWFHAGWAHAIDKYLSAEEADEIAAHFDTEGGKLQRRVIELVIGEVVMGNYTRC